MGKLGFNYSVLLAMCILSSALAYPALGLTSQYCTDANILQVSNASYDGADWTNITTYNYCANGCNNVTYSCNPAQYSDSNMLILFIPLIVAFLFFLIGSSIQSEDWAISLIFLFASLVFTFSGLGMVGTFLTNTAATAFSPINSMYWFSIILFVVLLFYYAIKTTLKVLAGMGKLKVKA